ncbi:MAG: ATP-dependent DNA helicase RecG [Candidatus Bipolaricaulota bacterium]|nr:ATP-dependent DNA helicase RecG [Candidatus Bipolaricaulota bacterium]MDW8127048.1 ATP-dependent DNA helicase RecG [Candidatus Bipolaricaulota bacterium]
MTRATPEDLPARVALVRKVLELERRKGFTDAAVVGGLEVLVQNQLPEVATLVAGYRGLSKPEREKALARLEARLERLLQGEDRLRLESPIRYAPGVGEKREALFQKLGIHTVEDLLNFLPRRLEDRTQLRPIKELRDGENALVEGILRAKSKVKVRPKLELVKAALDDGTGILFGVWFNQPWIWDQLEQGERYAFYGKVQVRFGEIQIENPVWEKADKKEQTGRVVPIYPSTEGLSQNILQGVIRRTLRRVHTRIPEVIPEEIRARYNLLPRREALRRIHFPESPEEFEKARETLAFEELFLLQVGLILHRRRETVGRAVQPDPTWIDAFLGNLPFPLTPSQKRAIAKIEADLRAPYPMLRLLQGDVGSGKTVVAAAACAMVASAGAQAAVMAPTEILAEQHFYVFHELLRPLPLKVGLLSGGLGRKEREELLSRIAQGEIQVVVGTHALLEEDVEFKDLALVVIDEQHRFGVIQRACLERKGRGTNVLVMSATPIPRTVVLTVYGEFELSVLEELPVPRRNVQTLWVSESRREEVYEEVGRRLRQGEKGYVVFPLVEESEELDLRAATAAYEELRARFGEVVGLLHGRMPSEEKRGVMAAFRAGKLRLLVATTVVELGLDVPDASFLVIEHADRFGLAQLHQMRGRIGRQGQAAVCWALADPTTEEARERLTAFRDLTDGFKIAEADLRIRGPGDLLGTAQHGFISKFRAADLVHDLGLLERARTEAKRLAEKGIPPEISAEVERRFGKDLELLGV